MAAGAALCRRRTLDNEVFGFLVVPGDDTGGVFVDRITAERAGKKLDIHLLRVRARHGRIVERWGSKNGPDNSWRQSQERARAVRLPIGYRPLLAGRVYGAPAATGAVSMRLPSTPAIADTLRITLPKASNVND